MTRRFGADVVLAVVLPVASALALVALQPDRGQPQGQPPVETPLTSASVICPGPLPGSGDVLGVSTVGADPGAKVAGDVQVGLGPSTTPLKVRSDKVSTAPAEEGPTVVSGSGDLAPGLVAGRSRSAPLAATDCGPPMADQWFTAAGADATHHSVIELVNPDAGPAIADITVRSPSGVLDVPALRGISVPGHTSTEVDLGQVVPRRGELSVLVHTSRGRMAAHVVDSYDELGKGVSVEDWLPAQDAPSTSSVLMGLVKGAGDRTLVLANPGADEVRASIKVVTASSVYEPSGVEPVRVAPDTTEAVSLDDVLKQAAKGGALGVVVEATGPVTASLRQVVGDDLSLLAAAPALDATTAAVVPTGPKRLLLGGPDAVGVATVTSYSAKGKQLDQQRVELVPDAGADVAIPDDAALVTLTPERTTVRAAVLLSGTGTAVEAMRPLVLTGLVPDVRPGVP
ncbi:MAG TPA: DUF5719 family protein [Nocardioides sp.]|uniref:DUF5719 family protein n=1 Tax=Nocardioides sp. TaxID=35761 RepID=UPI002E325D94|nr:DUF5719 family protein [Nocardioides sp.]HEX5088568.1 DUF5719 family protein [Nocardioides sp.]